ncbi:hypothetical protein V8G54_035133 [Vigna mungo]|uniref:Uncharacterized protein n=1 Tax=Vigna mungo TaxID=3915 RepID=A0AAQ3MEG6_VIGMU
MLEARLWGKQNIQLHFGYHSCIYIYFLVLHRNCNWGWSIPQARCSSYNPVHTTGRSKHHSTFCTILSGDQESQIQNQVAKLGMTLSCSGRRKHSGPHMIGI